MQFGEVYQRHLQRLLLQEPHRIQQLTSGLVEVLLTLVELLLLATQLQM